MRLARSLLLLPSVGLGCIELPEFEQPPPSRVSWLSYSEPTLELKPRTAAALGASLVSVVDAFDELCGWGDRPSVACRADADACDACLLFGWLRERLDALGSQIDFGGGSAEIPAAGGQTADLGSARLRHVCGAGRLDARTNFDTEGFGPVVWGSFDDCRLTPGPEGLIIRGNVRVDFVRRFRRLEDFDDWVQVEVDGVTLVSGQVQATALDMRWHPSTAVLQIRFTIDGDDGVLVVRPGATAVAVIDAQRIWACSFEMQRCTSGTEVLAW